MKYAWYLDNNEYQTNICEGVNRNPVYDYKFHMNVDCVTEDLLKYFDKDALCFKVYGTPTAEKYRKQMTIQEEKKVKGNLDNMLSQANIMQYISQTIVMYRKVIF